MIKILTAKFAGQCSKCGDAFAPGMKIAYDTVTKTVAHALTTSCDNGTDATSQKEIPEMRQLIFCLGLALAGMSVMAVYVVDAQQLYGLYVRPDGKVMIDAWDVVSGRQVAMPENRSSVKATVTAFPTGVVFGLTVKDSTQVCRETAKGSVCKTLGELFR